MLTAAIALALGMGVGAADSNTIIVRIDGKETRVKLAGVNAGDARGAAFANCLVAGRVVRIKGPRSAATATLLDDRSVAAHINEFVQTATSANPCTIGRAAYEPVRPAAVAAAAPASNAAAPAKKKPREVHISFAPGSASKPSGPLPPVPQTTNEWSQNVRRPAAPAAKVEERPTLGPPVTVRSYEPQPAGTYTMPVVGSTTPLPAGSAQPGLKQQGTQPLQQQGTQPIPTTTYSPTPQPPL